MSEDKTEPATWKRRKKARDEGQVARSQELVTSVILLVFLHSLPAVAPGIADRATGFCLEAFAAAGKGRLEAESIGSLALSGLNQVVLLAAPLLALVCVTALVANVAQVGLHFTPKLLQPKPHRLNPLQGLKKLVSPRSGVELLKGSLKLGIVAFSGWKFLAANWETIFALAETSPGVVAPRIGAMAFEMAKQMVATLAIIAALDYAYQRWEFERNLRMTKQEVRDEFKEAEGNPEIKAKIRRKQREISRRRMMADVKTASVVITNPTHFAVALRYEMGTGGAPKVVAKGQDLLALRIREIAAEAGVPTVENPPLARGLYKLAEVGDEIPASLYRAVAEVLAMVWKLDARRRGV